MTTQSDRQGVRPHGQALRDAIRWLSEHGRHDPAAVEEACRRFDLSPLDEAFLRDETRRLGLPRDADDAAERGT